jgi:hypothetical protein
MATSTATRGRITTIAGYVIAGIGERIVGVRRGPRSDLTGCFPPGDSVPEPPTRKRSLNIAQLPDRVAQQGSIAKLDLVDISMTGRVPTAGLQTLKPPKLGGNTVVGDIGFEPMTPTVST